MKMAMYVWNCPPPPAKNHVVKKEGVNIDIVGVNGRVVG